MIIQCGVTLQRAGRFSASALAGIACLNFSTDPALAQRASPDFAGKTISLYIGSDAGGGYDFYGRLFARHFGEHIAGKPKVAPQNMPGAGSLRQARV